MRMRMHVQKRLGTIALVLASSAFACFGPKKVQLSASPDVPAAQALAKVSSTDNGNTNIELSVQHLGTPGRVRDGANVYIVWVRAEGAGAQAQNVGALKLDSDLNGRITTTTPLRTFDLFITPESSQTATFPSGPRVLFARISAK